MLDEQIYTLVHTEMSGCVCTGCHSTGVEASGVTDSDAERHASAHDTSDLLPDELRDIDSHRAAAADGIEAQEQTARGISVGFDTNGNDADQPVDGLMSGRSWDRTDLTFSFPNSANDYGNNYFESASLPGFRAFSNTQKAAARDALDDFAKVSGLSFTELTGANDGDADLRAAMSSSAGTAFAYYPYSNDVGGDSFYNTTNFNNPVVGNYAYFTMLHEYGHALGLKHGHETGGPGAIPTAWDSSEFSVMTYRSYVGKSTSYGLANETWGFAQSLMMLDIAAIQRLYGANFQQRSGDTVYSFSTSSGAMLINGVEVATPGANRIFRTIWDGNGNDTYDFTNYSTDLAIDLAPGGYVDLDVGGLFQRAALENGFRGNFEYARGHVFNAMQYEGDARSLIENANGGSGNDTFWGNAAANIFRGKSGDDVFYDSAGSDTYHGGSGTDTVRFAQNLSGFTIDYVNGFLEVAGNAVDRIADNVEQLIFGNQTFSFNDLVPSNDPPPPPPNEDPDARNDSVSGTEGTNLTNLNLLGNDADPEGRALSIVAIDGQSISAGQTVTLSSGAQVVLNGNGTVTYRQNGVFESLQSGQTGNDSFTYTISDPEGATDTATVSVSIDGVGQPSPSPSDAAMEIGTLSVTQNNANQWHTVTFSDTIEDARVVMGPLSFNGGQAAAIRVRDVTDTGFRFQVDEWDYLDGAHVAETISWMAVSAGTHTLASGQVISAGRTTAQDDDVVSVSFGGYTDAPAVFAQVSSYNGAQAVTTRITDVSDDRFQFAMEEEERSNQNHVQETVDWIAIDYDTAGALDVSSRGGVTDGWASVGYQQVGGDVALLAAMQTMNGGDTATLRARNIDGNSAQIRVHEETSRDSEIRHVAEEVAYLTAEEGRYDLL